MRLPPISQRPAECLLRLLHLNLYTTCIFDWTVQYDIMYFYPICQAVNLYLCSDQGIILRRHEATASKGQGRQGICALIFHLGHTPSWRRIYMIQQMLQLIHLGSPLLQQQEIPR
jgi:hypothetical protein